FTTSFIHCVRNHVLHEGRIEYEGLLHELEENYQPRAPDWIRGFETTLSLKLLAIEQPKDVPKAFRIVERARGRVAADMLRTRPTDPGSPDSRQGSEQRKIVDIQIRLQQAGSTSERRLLLQRLVEAEE